MITSFDMFRLVSLNSYDHHGNRNLILRKPLTTKLLFKAGILKITIYLRSLNENIISKEDAVIILLIVL